MATVLSRFTILYVIEVMHCSMNDGRVLVMDSGEWLYFHHKNKIIYQLS